jgi:hypothetical protein
MRASGPMLLLGGVTAVWGATQSFVGETMFPTRAPFLGATHATRSSDLRASESPSGLEAGHMQKHGAGT